MVDGHVVVDSIAPVELADITDDLARESQFADAADLLKTAKHGSGDNVYLIRFHYLPPGGWERAGTDGEARRVYDTSDMKVRSPMATSTRRTSRGGLSRSRVMAFLATANGDRAREFYEQVVGLRFVSDDPFALVFDANGVTLRIQKVDKVSPAPYTALGWKVRDVAATLRSLGNRGVQPERFRGLGQDAVGVWTSPSGARIAWFRDPDGHVLSLTQG
jgi:catechol 2,3-dioxygenase-like lactoylglutathione lyase family enzyme